MARILLIEDDIGIHKVLSYNLKLARHDVVSAHRGREGLELARGRRPDLVLLDVMLPDLPGTKICSALRSDKATERLPIIMLTARGDEIDRVLGFELGADDYVVKPFCVRELMLRIEALLRRCKAAVDPQPTLVEVGALTFTTRGFGPPAGRGSGFPIRSYTAWRTRCSTTARCNVVLGATIRAYS